MDLSGLESKIKIQFKDRNLLQSALTHRSYLNENRRWPMPHNERLEFLGDAVLELITTEFLYRNYPNPEGELTNLRSALVNYKILRSEEHTSELQSPDHLVCRLLLEKKKK